MRQIRFPFLCLTITLALANFSRAQAPATGIPPFASIGGGPFDQINLGNLNAHFGIPVFHKAGRGMPFTYDLSYDSSIWYPLTAGSTTTWTNVANWGWRGQTEAAIGYISYQATIITCSGPNGSGHTTLYAWTGYHDDFGINHKFRGAATFVSDCYDETTATKLAIDGSGYTINAGGSNATVTSSSGRVIHAPLNPQSGAGTATDANGNQITVNGSYVFTDTLGATALTITGAGTPASPLRFTYTAPSGTPASYIVNYVSKNVQTHFGCLAPLVHDTTVNNVSLPSNVTLPDGTQYVFTYETTKGVTGYVTGRLASVQLPTGGTITYAYSGGSGDASHNAINCDDGTAVILTRTLSPGGQWTYTRTGSGSSWTTKVTDPTAPTHNETTISFAKDTATSEPTQNFYELQRLVYQGTAGGTLLLTTSKCYDNNFTNCTTAAVTSPITKLDSYYQPPGLSAAVSETTYDNNTLLSINHREFDYGTILKKDTTTNYNTALGNNIIDHPSSVTVLDGSGNLLAKTTYTYDDYSVQAPGVASPQHVPITGSRGNLTTINMYKASASFLTKHFHYYDTGMVLSATDVNGTDTTFTYGTTAQGSSTISCGNSFPTTIALPVGSMSTSTTWNCTGGVATSSTDVNGNPSSVLYNDAAYWRPASSTDSGSFTTNYAYFLAGGSIPASSESYIGFNTGTSIAEQLTSVDGFGRPYISQQRQGPTPVATYDTVHTNYDVSGRVSGVSMPYPSTKSVKGSAPETTTTYDGLGRVSQITDAGGGYVSYSYSQNTVLQTTGPAPLTKKQLQYDGLGRLTSVCEITTSLPGNGPCGQNVAATGYVTTYTYDFVGGFSRVVVAQTTQQRTYVYDMLGRLIKETNPESDLTTYTFESTAACPTTSLGDLVAKVDKVGNVICYTYDGLHRVTSATYSGPDSANTPAKTFVYDSATVNGVAMANPKGHLVEAYTGPSGAKVTDLGFSYSLRNEVKDAYEWTAHSGGYYKVETLTWATGAMQTLTSNIVGLPGQTYGMNPMGRTNAVTASSGTNPVSSTTYDLSTYKATVNFPSLDSDVFTFDPNTGRLNQYKFNVASNADTGSMTWNANGTLGQFAISNTVPGTSDTQTCSYTHDDLSRVASVNCLNGVTKIWNQTFTYDAFGNIKKDTTSPGLSFQPGYSATTNWITSLLSGTPSTDANGRMTNDGTHTYGWDADGNMKAMDTTTLTYDALGRMVEKAVGPSYTQIVYSPLGAKFALMNGQTLQKAFIPLPAGATAVYTSAGLAYYRHSDHLGSSRLATTPSRTLYSSSAYAPFGEPYAPGITDLSFTGQDQDTVSGLYDFMFRKQNQAQGRWLSPDPAGLAAVDPTNPQSWNRYGYVRNQPCNTIDPLGLSDCNLNIAVNHIDLMNGQEQLISLGEINRILGLANVGATLSNEANANFTVNLKNNPTGLGELSFSAVNSDLLGLNDNTSGGGPPANSASVWVNNTEAAAAGMDMGIALGRVMTHELLHWALQIPGHGITPGPLEVGIMSQTLDPILRTGMATITSGQASLLSSKCRQAHPKNGGGGPGTGGPGSARGGPGDGVGPWYCQLYFDDGWRCLWYKK